MTILYQVAVATASEHRDVSPAQVFADRRATRIVDVREPHEFTGELGHIQGAELVPLATVARSAAHWTKDEALVLVCRSGGRSTQAANALTAAGFRRVMNMVGGMLAWNEECLPVEGATGANTA